jgi:hypothetical protein
MCKFRNNPDKVEIMQTTDEIIGYQVAYIPTQSFVHVTLEGENYIECAEPLPISRGDAFRRLAGILDQRSDLSHEDFDVVPVFREVTPLESTAKELSGLLLSLTERHGLDLGLTREQIEARIATEIAEFGVGLVPIERINNIFSSCRKNS